MKNLLFTFAVLFSSIAASNPVDTGHAKVSLITDLSQSQSEEFYVGVRLEMQKGWHTYWENPGDSGGTFEALWDLPAGLKIEEGFSNWPTPTTIPYPPLMTYGYENEVIFPFKVKKIKDAILGMVNLEFNFLICADICIPETATLQLDLKTANGSQTLTNAISLLPKKDIATQSKHQDDALVIGFKKIDQDFTEAYFFPRNTRDFYYTAKQKITQNTDGSFAITVPTMNGDFNSFSGILSLDGKGYQVQESLQIHQSESSLSIWQALLFAFIGGLILNLMPCVFPVISLKVLSFVAMGGGEDTKIRNHALIFSSGIICTFMVIAISLILIRSSGAMIGWGYQLQSPMVVGVLALVILAIGFILLTSINMGSSLTSVGSSLQSRNDYAGSFGTGVLAVVVASPCTAPFMGAAIGYALLQPSIATLPIFLSLAVGFAGPYLILAMKPQWLSALPKPGAWMEQLKQFFAFPMIATALWLMWVFSLQTSNDALIQLLVISLLLGLSIWMINSFKHKLKWAGLVLTAILGMPFLFNVQNAPTTAIQQTDLVSWYPELEMDLQESNQAYLINFTAAWCITCQANDKLALSRPRVIEYLASESIQYVKADWTNRNEQIAKALAQYQRTGIPLYVFWKPGMLAPQILPAVLTEDILIRSIEASI